MGESWLLPQWPIPERVMAVTTTRVGGVSGGPYAGLNLADHVGDDQAAVLANRNWLRQQLALPDEPCWLAQSHSTRVVAAARSPAPQTADGAYSRIPGEVCAVLTADCLPLLLSNAAGTEVAAVHCGWRGLSGGIIEACLGQMGSPAEQCLAWLGPTIGAAVYEVGAEVRTAFLRHDPACGGAFKPVGAGRWLADLGSLASHRLRQCGVTQIFGGEICSFQDARFYSYRRDGVTGRMASLIWIRP